MANNYQLQATNVTATSVTIAVISATPPATAAKTIGVILVDQRGVGVTHNLNDPGTTAGQIVGAETFTGLNPETIYFARVVSPDSSNNLQVKTKIDPDTPRIATQQQWEDLASRVDSANGKIISHSGAPTISTIGTVGQLYEDTTNGKLYQCTAIDSTDPQNPSYTWSEVGAGGSGPTVVQTTGTSQTDVMSQDAVTKRVYPRFGVYNDAIGIVGANESQDSSAGAMSTGVGSGHKARGDNSVAIGAQATIYAAGAYSVAIGSTAKTEGHSRAVAIGNVANAAFDNRHERRDHCSWRGEHWRWHFWARV